jgi:hypothetical protein
MSRRTVYIVGGGLAFINMLKTLGKPILSYFPEVLTSILDSTEKVSTNQPII